MKFSSFYFQSVVFNFPKFFELTINRSGKIVLNEKLSNSILYNQVVFVERNLIIHPKYFKVYKQYADLVVTVLIPWIALSCLNFRILLAVKSSKYANLTPNPINFY